MWFRAQLVTDLAGRAWPTGASTNRAAQCAQPAARSAATVSRNPVAPPQPAGGCQNTQCNGVSLLSHAGLPLVKTNFMERQMAAVPNSFNFGCHSMAQMHCPKTETKTSPLTPADGTPGFFSSTKYSLHDAHQKFNSDTCNLF